VSADDAKTFGPRGDGSRHLALGDLESRLAALAAAPQSSGRVVAIVRRLADKTRETLGVVELTVEAGVPGDAWERRQTRNPDAQITVMQADVAALIANGQPLTVFGDNLFVDLDLSAANLPAGSRLRIGEALLEMTPKPHNGCHKFATRFGPDAQHFVSKADLRHRNLRGIHVRVIAAGKAAVGDPVEVL
jgi:MOSC domain-containing protein YiiM